MFLKSFTRSILAASSLCLLASCGDSAPANDANLIAFNDYEAVVGWGPEQGTITREQAHSGRYAVKVDGEHEFGMGYVMPLGKATARKPRKLRIAAWAFMVDAKSTARLGLQIIDPATGKETFGDGINFAEQVKDVRKWVEISKDITIPETTTSAHELRVFLWRSNASTPAYIDDLRISLVE